MVHFEYGLWIRKKQYRTTAKLLIFYNCTVVMQEVVGKYRLKYLKVKGRDTCNLLSNCSEKKGEEEEESKRGKY